MNRVIIIGNLTRDPEVRYTAKGTAVAKFGVAVSRRFKDQNGQEVTDFFDVDAWGKLGELVGNYLAKGRKVCVEGEMRQERWEDREGNKRVTWKIHAENVEFLSPRGEGGGGQSRGPGPGGGGGGGKKPAPPDDDIQFNDIDDQDIEEELGMNQPYGF